jgi:hypothetical protein
VGRLYRLSVMDGCLCGKHLFPVAPARRLRTYLHVASGGRGKVVGARHIRRKPTVETDCEVLQVPIAIASRNGLTFVCAKRLYISLMMDIKL